jgi:phosphoribosylanthranilate isomerase
MLTQIYEVQTPEEAEAISAIGVDHVGVLVGWNEFPREIGLDEAARVAAAIRWPSKFCALFLTADITRIEAGAKALRPHVLHLGAAPERHGPEATLSLKRAVPDIAIMRSIPVIDETSIALAQSYDGIADFLLLDSHRRGDNQIGALGITHDWTISARIVKAVKSKVILAGGLGPENVADSIRAVRPGGVDSKTKTDVPGTHAKDVERVRLFDARAKEMGAVLAL